ncbi:adenylate/guanylate cyclase domain-containing protein [uncultured Sphingomonas sp.]|uniref:adenylate/guanylate cyclase domain-containing protein n=1 Tax=uncultured Sphingomonas sp. TaxID=158754 RepID=UPI0025CD9879|nr:adenylate/guanylate cyclase domain-containing protein [uncultured Sphingomonas sp.]
MSKIFRDPWSVTKGTAVPESTDLTLANTGRTLEAAVLYADLAASTALVDASNPQFAAEVYKTFLLVSARIIRSNGGTITAYDGDRIMAVYLGPTPCSNAVKTAFMINWARINVIQPRMSAQYLDNHYVLRHTCGIDYSTLMAAKTGVRGANDLVWVGRAANYAAKLSSESSSTPTWITQRVYDRLTDWAKFGGNPREVMWKPMQWAAMNYTQVYCSDWHWSFS